MKVTVNCNLNVRVGKPGLNAPSYQYLAPGSILEVDGKLYKGDSFDGIDTWYKDEAGNYYWSGGIKLNLLQTIELQEMVNYNKLVQNIPDNWRVTEGKDIVIAIVDTGCSNHFALQNSIKDKYNSIKNNKNVDDISNSSHGTFISGIIAARNNPMINGIAPQVQLLIVKVSDDDTGIEAENVLNGLKWLKNQSNKPNIINISLDFDPYPHQQEFIDIFKYFNDNSIIVYAAAQNDLNLFGDNIFYPATEDNVYGVGTLNVGNSIIKNKSINKSVKYIIPNIIYYSTIRNNDFNTNKGCSFSTAITSAITSLSISYFNKQGLSFSMKDFNQLIRDFEPSTFNESINLYKNEI
jgi:subtilisin family serine protease